MIPKKGKAYLINFFNKEDEEFSYEGESTYTGETELGEDDKTLYRFTMPNNILT